MAKQSVSSLHIPVNHHNKHVRPSFNNSVSHLLTNILRTLRKLVDENIFNFRKTYWFSNSNLISSGHFCIEKEKHLNTGFFWRKKRSKDWEQIFWKCKLWKAASYWRLLKGKWFINDLFYRTLKCHKARKTLILPITFLG